MICKTLRYIKFLSVAVLIMACGAEGNNTGLEYAPNMYHSVPYEPLTQITNEDAGDWVDSNDEDGHGEYYNSNPLNPYGMTMRMPPENTVRRDKYLPYNVENIEQAASLSNPLDANSESVLADGQALYQSFCQHCHGATGEGDGPVADFLAVGGAGVANLKSNAVINASQGHIFYVITNGIRTMAPHGSQIRVEDRWKIAAYVKQLQQQ
jgi:mono/diheme cytochrome c family protein